MSSRNYASYGNLETLLSGYADKINASWKFKSTSASNADNILETGIYIVNTSDVSNLPTTEVSMDYILEVIRLDEETDPSSVLQVAYRSSVDTEFPLYARRYISSSWSAWRGVPTSDIAPSTFVGTVEQWNNLSSAEKSRYIIVDITDDNSNSGIYNDILVKGYYNTADERFYADSSYITELVPDPNCLYIDLTSNVIFRYDSANDVYISLSSSTTFNSSDFAESNNEVSLTPAQRTFTGTRQEWEDLSSSEKALYGTVQITDDDEAGYRDVYSTSEFKTNKVWIDGKPIYRKVITGLSLDGIWNDSKYYQTLNQSPLVANVDTIISSAGMLNTATYKSFITLNIEIVVASNVWNFFRIYSGTVTDVILEYTKTTD